MRRITGLIGLCMAFGLAVAVTVGTAAGATTPKTAHVHGTQTVVDEDAGTYLMHGSLVGAWAITSFEPVYVSDTLYVARGTERFAGCLDQNRNGTCQSKERHGRIRFSFTSWANFDGTTGAYLGGGCVHPVTGGSGGFANATGTLLMKDTVHGDDVRTTYWGELQFGGAAAATRTAEPAATAAAVGNAPHSTC